MIVFLNEKKELIELYNENGMEEFDFDDIEEVVKTIGRKKILYITNAIETNAKQISDLVESMMYNSINTDDPVYTYKYLQYQQDKTMRVSDINLKFSGKDDCKLIDERIYNLIQASSQLNKLIQKGVVKVISHKEMLRAKRKKSRELMKNKQKREKAKDAALDSILMDTSAPGSAAALASMMSSGAIGGAVETDSTDEIIKESKMSETEYLAKIMSGELAP